MKTVKNQKDHTGFTALHSSQSTEDYAEKYIDYNNHSINY